MAKLSILAGTTSKLIDVFIQDTSVTTGAGLTGLTNASSGLTWYYYREGAATSTQVTSIASMTLGTWTTKGFIVIDGTNMPGCYQLGVPDAAIAAGAKSVIMLLKGVTNMAPLVLEIELTAVDNQDGVHGGMSALPNTAVTTNASLLTSGTGTDQLSVTSGRIDIGKALGTAVTLDANNVLNVSTKYLAGTALTARDIGASVLLSSGTGTGQLDFTSGVVKANATQWLGGAIPAVNVTGVPVVDAKYLLGTIFATPATAGIIDANVKNINNVAAATPGAAGGVFIAGTNAATTVTTSFTTTLTGNLTGSVGSVTGAVGSVTGAVGSVTGNVGGNVTGSVGSVVGLTASNLDTTVSSRMATYTQPTGFLAATFPSGTVANTTNITAGTITTATNLTNAPTSGDFTATMKTSLNAATPASVVGSVGSVTGSVGSVVGLTASNLDATVSSRATPAQVLTQVQTGLATDTYAEPTGAPPATNTLAAKIGFLYEVNRNKITVTSATMTFYDNADAAQWSKALSDDGTTYSEAKGS